MATKAEQKMSRTREGGKPRWRYHWGNHIPEDLVSGKTEVLFRSGTIGTFYHNLIDDCFLSEPILGEDPTDIIAYRIK